MVLDCAPSISHRADPDTVDVVRVLACPTIAIVSAFGDVLIGHQRKEVRVEVPRLESLNDAVSSNLGVDEVHQLSAVGVKEIPRG